MTVGSGVSNWSTLFLPRLTVDSYVTVVLGHNASDKFVIFGAT